jgi:hypothetical protein
VQGNTFQYLAGWQGATSHGLNLFTGGTSTGKMAGSILSNTITHAPTPEAAGFAISLSPTGHGAFVANVGGPGQGNTVTWPSQALVDAQSGNGSNSRASMDVNVKNNTLSFADLDAAADHTVQVTAGAAAGDSNVVCADIANNTFSKGGSGSGVEIRPRRLSTTSTLRLPNYSGGATSAADLGSYFRGPQGNLESPTAAGLPSVAGSFPGGGVTVPGGGACATS